MPITDALALAMLRSSPPKRGQWCTRSTRRYRFAAHIFQADSSKPMSARAGCVPDPARYDWSARLGNLRVTVASLTARVTDAPHVQEIVLCHPCHFVAPLAFAGCEALA